MIYYNGYGVVQLMTLRYYVKLESIPLKGIEIKSKYQWE